MYVTLDTSAAIGQEEDNDGKISGYRCQPFESPDFILASSVSSVRCIFHYCIVVVIIIIVIAS